MIELLYLASQIQCSAGEGLLNIQVDVYHQQELVQTMNLQDKALIDVASIKDLEFEYKAIGDNANCGLATPTEMVLAPDGTLPGMDGIYEQDSVQTLLSDLKEYEELFLVELGSTDSSNAAFDLQDVVFKVDKSAQVNNITSPVANAFPD